MSALVPPIHEDLVDRTAEIVASYVQHNALTPSELPRLIASVHAALGGLSSPAEAATPEPAVPIRKAISADALVCL